MKMKRLVLTFMVIGISLVLFACNREMTVDPTIVSMTVNERDIQGEISIDAFDLNEVRLTILYSDGTSTVVHLNEAMISPADLAKLNREGRHTISIRYEGVTTSFTIELVDVLDELTLTLLAIYQLGVEEDVIEESYEEWLERIRGPKGDDGREVFFRVSGGFIQWQYVGESTWQNVIELALLTGPKGDSGDDGQAVELQVSNTHIQWRYTGDFLWQDLISLALLMGPKGDEGEEAPEVFFHVNDGYIEWQYEGEDEWHQLIEVATLVGPKGDTGRGIVEVYLTPEGELMVVFNDGTAENVGHLLTFHTVTFVDYDGRVLHVEAVLRGFSASGPVIPSRDGHRFIGWDTSFLEVMSDLTVQATYIPQEVTLSFDVQGGAVIAPLKQHAFTDIDLPEDVIKSGYHFGGWYRDPLYHNPFELTTMPSDDMMVYAKWIKRLSVDDLHTMMASFNYAVTYGEHVNGDTILAYELMKDDHRYALTYMNASVENDLYHNLRFTMARVQGINVAIFDLPQFGCLEHITLSNAHRNELLALFDDVTLLPAMLDNDWFERVDDVYVMKSSYFHDYIEAMTLEPSETTMLYYRIQHLADGFTIDLAYNHAGKTVEKAFRLYHYNSVDVAMHTGDVCEANHVGLIYEMTDYGAVITGYQGFAKSLVLPERVEGVPVVKLADEAFKDSLIEEIHVSDDVVEIGAYAFDGASHLKKVTFGEGSALATIGDFAFSGALALRSMTLPSGVHTFGYGAFYQTSSLRSLDLPLALTHIAGYVFYESGLETIFIHHNIVEIGEGAFSRSSLYGIAFESGSQLEFIGHEAFSYTSLYQVFLPDSVTTIGGYAFSYTSLRAIFVPETVVNMQTDAFYGSTPTLTIYTAHESKPATWAEFWNADDHAVEWGWSFTVDSILDGVMASTNYQEIMAVEGDVVPYPYFEYRQTTKRSYYYELADLGHFNESYVSTHDLGYVSYVYDVDAGCWHVDFVSFEDFTAHFRAPSIGLLFDRSFEDAWFDVSFTTLRLKEAYYDDVMTHLTLSNTGIELMSYVIRRTSQGYSVSILLDDDGEHVEVYYSIHGLNQTVIDLPDWSYCDMPVEFMWGYTISDDQAEITAYYGNENHVEIPSMIGPYPVRAIGEEALSGLSFVQEVVVPASVESIGFAAFMSMRSLVSVVFEEGSVLTTIGDAAFAHAWNLETFVIPSTVTMIGEMAFHDTSKLTIYTELTHDDMVAWPNWNPQNGPVVYAFTYDGILPAHYDWPEKLYHEASAGEVVVVEFIVYKKHEEGYFLSGGHNVFVSVQDQNHGLNEGDKVQIIGEVSYAGTMVELMNITQTYLISTGHSIAFHLQGHSTLDIYLLTEEAPESTIGRYYGVDGYVYVDEDNHVYMANYTYYLDDYGYHYTYYTDNLVRISPLTDPDIIEALRALEGKFVGLPMHFLGAVDGVVHGFVHVDVSGLHVGSPILTHYDFAHVYDIGQPLHMYMVIGTVVAVFTDEYLLYDGENMIYVTVSSGGLPSVGDYIRTTGEFMVSFNTYKLVYSSYHIVLDTNVSYTIEPEVITLEELYALTVEDKTAHGRLYRVTGTLTQEPIYSVPALYDGTHTIVISSKSPLDSREALQDYLARHVTIDVFLYNTEHHIHSMLEVIFIGTSEDVIEVDEPFGNIIGHFTFDDEDDSVYENYERTAPFYNDATNSLFDTTLYRAGVVRSHFVMYSTDALTLAPRTGTGYSGSAWATFDFDDQVIETLVFETYFWNEDTEANMTRYELQVWDDDLAVWVTHTDLLSYIEGRVDVVTVVVRGFGYSRFRFYAEADAPSDFNRILIDNVRVYE